MQIEKALINDRLHVSKVSWKFWILAVYDFAVIYLQKVAYLLAVSIVFNVYKQRFTAQ